jgi:FAD binding domain
LKDLMISEAATAALRGRLAGSLATPGEPEYEELRQSWNSSARQRPALVVAPSDADDVAAAVRFAADHGRRVAVQSTGHGAAGVVGEDVLLLNMRGLDEVRIDVDRCTATICAGATWGAVAQAAEPSGLAGVAGTASGVGVAGYTFHGGMGWMARAHGLGSASLMGVEYVDAEGVVRHADEKHDPDALWAFRGGAGVGVATRVELRLWRHPRVYAGARFWSLEHAPLVLERWLDWSQGLPESITSLAWAFQAPDVPAVPEWYRGRSMLALGACGLELETDRASVEGLFAELPEPLMDTFSVRPPSELGLVQPSPPGPVPSRGDGRLLRRFDASAAADVLRASGIGSGGPLISIEIRHLGGRAADPQVPGALTSLPGEFLLAAVGAAATSEQATAVDAAFGRLGEAAAPIDLGRAVAAFRGGRTDAPGALDPVVRERLRELRQARDPERRFHRPKDLGA